MYSFPPSCECTSPPRDHASFEQVRVRVRVNPRSVYIYTYIYIRIYLYIYIHIHIHSLHRACALSRLVITHLLNKKYADGLVQYIYTYIYLHIYLYIYIYIHIHSLHIVRVHFSASRSRTLKK